MGRKTHLLRTVGDHLALQETEKEGSTTLITYSLGTHSSTAVKWTVSKAESTESLGLTSHLAYLFARRTERLVVRLHLCMTLLCQDHPIPVDDVC